MSPETHTSQSLFPRSSVEIFLETLSLLVIVAGFVMIFFYWSQLPERISIHYDFYGYPDGWSKKSTLFLLHSMTLIVYALTFIIGLGIKPLARNKVESAEPYRISRILLSVLKFEILFFILIVEWVIIISAINGKQSFEGLLNTAVFGSVLFVTFAVYLYRYYRIEKR